MRTLAHDYLVKLLTKMEPLRLVPCSTQIQIESW